MRLESVFVSEYKNLKNFTLGFDGASFIDVFVGKNGSGNSVRATQFRQWATRVLREFAIKGFVLDRKRLENGVFLGEDYFERLLAEIREIRLSERKFYGGWKQTRQAEKGKVIRGEKSALAIRRYLFGRWPALRGVQDAENGDRFARDAIHHDVVGMHHRLAGIWHTAGTIEVGVGLYPVGVGLEILVERERRQGFVAGDEIHDALAIRYRQRMPDQFHPLAWAC